MLLFFLRSFSIRNRAETVVKDMSRLLFVMRLIQSCQISGC